MSWRIATSHVSRYRYASPVVASYNEARMTPSPGPEQLVLDSELRVEPSAVLFRYVDYWGTLVHAFDVHEPHDELVVTGTSVVETTPTAPSLAGEPGAPADPAAKPGTGPVAGSDDPGSWQQLRSTALRDRFSELLAPTSYAPFDAELAGAAGDLAAGADPAEAAERVVAFVHDHLRYEAGTTGVSTSGLEAWRLGTGVCQDFAHLALSMLRQLGIPARYTSGYLHPSAEASIGDRVPGASHAWIEAWVGRFVALDPTIGSAAGVRHVTVARGRDYADVTPLRGVYHGGEHVQLTVEVQLTRLA